MERNEVSIHEAKLFWAFRAQPATWSTSKEMGERSGISPRTARAHCLKLTTLGIVDVAEVFPAHRYRLAEKADKRNGGYVRRLEFACEVFGLQSGEPILPASGGTNG